MHCTFEEPWGANILGLNNYKHHFEVHLSDTGSALGIWDLNTGNYSGSCSIRVLAAGRAVEEGDIA